MLDCFNNGLVHQLFAGVSASIGGFAVASLLSWVTPILPWLLSPESEIPMTTEDASWMVSLPIITNFLSPVPSGILSNKFGRKPVILSAGPLITLHWVLILYFKSLNWLLIGRCLHGAATGIIYTILPIYLGEIASKEYRGAITSLFYILYWFGTLFEYVTGPFLSFTNFTLLTLSPSVLFFVLFLFQPESPHFLVMKDKKDEARKVLSWLRCKPKNIVDEELDTIVHNVEIDNNKGKTSSWTELLATPTDRKALYLLSFVTTVRVMCGTFPIISYATQNFTTSRNLPFAPYEITIILGLALVVGACSSFFTVDVFGRRFLIIASCFVSAGTLLTAAAYYYIDAYTSVDVAPYNWVAPAAIIVYAAVNVGGLYPVTSAYTSELLTSSTRASGSAFCIALASFWSFINLKFYQTFIDVFGVYFNFLVFGLVCLIGAVVSCCVMPETKNKSFDQIRSELGK